jgi:hypothetical protein
VIEQIEDDELDDLLGSDEVTKEEKKKVGKLLPSEIWQGICVKCGKLAVRVFPPRRGLKTLEKKEGLDGLMKACQSEIKNQRILISTPSFNLILTGNHREAIGYNLADGHPSTCDMTVLLTDNPKKLIWHLFSRLRTVRLASMVNGVKFEEVEQWFDTLDEQQAALLMPGIVSFEMIPDPDQDMRDGPWYVAWVNTNKLSVISDPIRSERFKADPVWDSCIDPVIGQQGELSFIEYCNSCAGDNIIDIPKNVLQVSYYGGTIYRAVIEPIGTPGERVEIRVGITKDAIPTNPMFGHFVHLVPKQYWMIEAGRFRQGLSFEKAKPEDKIVRLDG